MLVSRGSGCLQNVHSGISFQGSLFQELYLWFYVYYWLLCIYYLFMTYGIYQCSHNGFLEKRYIVFRKNCILKNINILLNLRICQTRFACLHKKWDTHTNGMLWSEMSIGIMTLFSREAILRPVFCFRWYMRTLVFGMGY